MGGSTAVLRVARGRPRRPTPRRARAQLGSLRGCDVHESVILGPVDEGIFRSLDIQVTTEPVYATKSLYRKK